MVFVWLGLAALNAVGFTSTGVAVGSLAAATQASIGNVTAGGFFAALQSAAAVGGGALANGIGAGITVAAHFLWHIVHRAIWSRHM